MEKVYNLIIVAMKEEEKAILNSLNVKIFKDDDHYSFKLNDEEFLLFRGQIGKAMTSFMLGKIFSKYSIKRVFNLGTSGGYSKDIKALDIVIATKVGYFDVDVTAFNYSLGQVPEFPRFFETDMDYIEKKKDKLDKIDSFDIKYGLILSSDSFITKKNYLDYPLLKQDDPLCVEMEAASVGHCCYRENIPFIIIRSISDSLYDEDNQKDNTTNINACCKNCVEALKTLID